MTFEVIIKVTKTGGAMFEEIEAANWEEAEAMANEMAAEYNGEVVNLTAYVD